MKFLKNKFITSSLIVTIVILLSKLLGLLREILLANIFGTNASLDVFVLVSSIPIVLFYLVGNGVTISFLPILKGCMVNINHKESNAFTTSAILVLTGSGMLLFISGQIFTPQIISILAPGFHGIYQTIAINYFKFFLWIVFFLGIEGVLTGVLQAHGRVQIPALSNLVYGICMLIPVYIFRPTLDLNILAWILFSSYLARMLTCLFGIKWTTYRPNFQFSLAKPHLAKLIKLAPPVIIATLLMEINFFVDKSFASTVGVGAISAINYSEKVITLISSTAFSSLGFVFFPYITDKYNSGKKDFQKASNKSLQILLIISMFFSAICLFDSKNIVVLLFKGGEFNNESVRLTTEALTYFSVGLFAILLRDMIKKILFAMQNTIIPLFGGIFNCLCNVVLMIIFVPRFGMAAITASTSIAAIVEFIIILVFALKIESLLYVKQFIVNGLVYMIALSIGGALASCLRISFFSIEKLNTLLEIFVHAIIVLAVSSLISLPLFLWKRNRDLLK